MKRNSNKPTKLKEKVNINWQHFNNIPLISNGVGQAGVLDILGIAYNPTKKVFLCQEHDDHIPSAKILGDNNEKYNCFVCNANGTALNLVSQVLNLTLFESALFLDKYYPGGIDKEVECVVAPIITKIELTALGLKTNPFMPIYICNNNTSEKFSIEATEASDLLIDKALEYKDKVLFYRNGVLKNFPDLSRKDKEYIINKTNIDLVWIDNLIDKLREYERKVAEYSSAKELDDNTRTR